jgi:histidinol-phosphate aminotransferase
MDQRISQATRVVYVCNPNNPTGTLLPPDALRDFCISASKKVPVFVDEAYYEVVDPEHRTSMVDLVKAGHNVIVARTFSKVYGLAGLRIGYGIASPDVISQLERYKMSFQNVIGLRAALASLDDPEFETFSRVKIDEARRFTYALLDELGLRYTPSHGNFVLFHTGQDIQSFQTDMRWRNIGVGRPFPPYLDWCRLSMSKMEDMTAFADALRDWAQARS